MAYLQGEIVYIKFPFTNLSNYKLRPALIISNEKYNKKDNVIVLGIFGTIGITEYSLILDEKDLESGKMLKQSFFRFQNIFSLDKRLIERKIGILKKEKLKKINIKLNSYTYVS